MITQVVDELSVQINNKHQIIQFDELKKSPTCFCDQNSLKQILINLVENASKYSPEKSLISLWIEEEKSFCSIHIKDEGLGLTEDEQKHIFDEFFRVVSTGEVQQQGTGLGLSIVKRLIIQMGGNIWVNSKGPGTGATFSFSLPTA